MRMHDNYKTGFHSIPSRPPKYLATETSNLAYNPLWLPHQVVALQLTAELTYYLKHQYLGHGMYH